jgi:hypothetical protein
VQSTGEVKFSNTSYTIHVRARSLNLSLGQIIIESIPRPCSAKISRCHIHDVTVHLRGNSALQPQTFPQHYIHGVAICACSSTAASSLHYILVVGLWQRRNSSFRKTHTFGTCYVDTVTCYVDTVTCYVDTVTCYVDTVNVNVTCFSLTRLVKCVVEDSILNPSYTQSLPDHWAKRAARCRY